MTRAEEVVHAARYFGVSFGAMRRRLVDEERLAANADLFSGHVRPITIARRWVLAAAIRIRRTTAARGRTPSAGLPGTRRPCGR